MKELVLEGREVAGTDEVRKAVCIWDVSFLCLAE